MANEQMAKVSVPEVYTTPEGKEVRIPRPRPMTYKERRRFRAAGYDVAFLTSKDKEDQSNLALATENMIDWILDEMYGGKDNDEPWYEDIPYNILAELAKATYQLTYGAQENVKN